MTELIFGHPFSISILVQKGIFGQMFLMSICYEKFIVFGGTCCF